MGLFADGKIKTNQDSETVDEAAEDVSREPVTYEALVEQYGKAFVDERIKRAKKYKNTGNLTTVAKWCEEDAAAGILQPGKVKQGRNKFNNIASRDYDYNAVEKQLLSQPEAAKGG